MCVQAWGTCVRARGRQQVTCPITCLIPLGQSHTIQLGGLPASDLPVSTLVQQRVPDICDAGDLTQFLRLTQQALSPALLNEKRITALLIMGVVKAKNTGSKALTLPCKEFAPIYQEGTEHEADGSPTWAPALLRICQGHCPTASRQSRREAFLKK